MSCTTSKPQFTFKGLSYLYHIDQCRLSPVGKLIYVRVGKQTGSCRYRLSSLEPLLPRRLSPIGLSFHNHRPLALLNSLILLCIFYGIYCKKQQETCCLLQKRGQTIDIDIELVLRTYHIKITILHTDRHQLTMLSLVRHSLN